MSFSPVDILMGLGDTGSVHTNGEQSSLDDSLIMSSQNDTMPDDVDAASFNSETLQDFGSLVSLPPGTLTGLFQSENSNSNDDGEQTIVSSAPSGATIPPPRASQDIWAISPHPRIVPGSTQSISTVCTDTVSYSRLLDSSVASDDSSSGDEGDDQSSSPDYSQALVASSRRDPDTHDPVSFMAVANNLMRDGSSSAGNEHWFNRFTEYDWEQFRHVAKMVVGIIDPPQRLIPLPPAPPAMLLSHQVTTTNAPYDARMFVPENFVCTICKDVIVGALTLDCGCPLPTVCMSCWENHQNNHSMLSNELGYVWVEERSCPSCHHPVTSSIPSTALDVAILQIVQSLDPLDMRICSLQHSYYSRLASWRKTVEEMNLANHQSANSRRDKLLAQLIEQEEAVFWKNNYQEKKLGRRQADSRVRAMLYFGQTAIALLAATLTSAGLSAIARR